MEVNSDKPAESGLMERFRKSWFPPAAVAGAFASFIAAAFRVRPAPLPARPRPAAPGRSNAVVLPVLGEPPSGPLERSYKLAAAAGSAGSSHPFLRSLAGIAVDSKDQLHALGDGEIRVFDAMGGFVRSWKAPENVLCHTVGPDGRVFLGMPGRIGIYTASGTFAGGFSAGEKNSRLTAVKTYRNELLVADASARFIRRYDQKGGEIGVIGTRVKNGRFMLPNGWLDFDLDSKGIVWAADAGRHRASAWSIDGSPLGFFGRFGMTDPADFVGCCNPVNLAVTPDGKIVTAEKMAARLKVYEPGGKLLAVIGPANFDPGCTHIHLAVDSRGRILAADPVRRELKIFVRDHYETNSRPLAARP